MCLLLIDDDDCKKLVFMIVVENMFSEYFVVCLNVGCLFVVDIEF